MLLELSKIKEINDRLDKMERYYNKHGSLDKISRAYKAWMRYNMEYICTSSRWIRRLRKMGWNTHLSKDEEYLELVFTRVHKEKQFPSQESLPQSVLRWIYKVMNTPSKSEYAKRLRKVGCKLYEEDYFRVHRQFPSKDLKEFIRIVRLTSLYLKQNGDKNYDSVVALILSRWKDKLTRGEFSPEQIKILDRYKIHDIIKGA